MGEDFREARSVVRGEGLEGRLPSVLARILADERERDDLRALLVERLRREFSKMDDWRKAQIAALGRDNMVAIIASAHRFTDKTEAAWAEICLANYDRLRELNGDDNDAEIDAWHDGYFAGRRNAPVSDDPNFAEGWFKGRCEILYPTSVVQVERPEGYYHAPLGTFE
jgi:hypothetical protein